MNTPTYNPFVNAASVAWAELTTDNAKQWYTDTAWAITLSTWATLGNLCNWLIALGATCRQWVDLWLVAPSPVAMPALLPHIQIVDLPQHMPPVVVVPVPEPQSKARRGRKPKTPKI